MPSYAQTPTHTCTHTHTPRQILTPSLQPLCLTLAFLPAPPPHQGDNNHMDDRLLYNRGQEWLHMKHIVGRAVGFLPYVGMVTIIMNDYPWLKVALIAVLGLLVVTSKE